MHRRAGEEAERRAPRSHISPYGQAFVGHVFSCPRHHFGVMFVAENLPIIQKGSRPEKMPHVGVRVAAGRGLA